MNNQILVDLYCAKSCTTQQMNNQLAASLDDLFSTILNHLDASNLSPNSNHLLLQFFQAKDTAKQSLSSAVHQTIEQLFSCIFGHILNDNSGQFKPEPELEGEKLLPSEENCTNSDCECDNCMIGEYEKYLLFNQTDSSNQSSPNPIDLSVSSTVSKDKPDSVSILEAPVVSSAGISSQQIFDNPADKSVSKVKPKPNNQIKASSSSNKRKSRDTSSSSSSSGSDNDQLPQRYRKQSKKSKTFQKSASSSSSSSSYSETCSNQNSSSKRPKLNQKFSSQYNIIRLYCSVANCRKQFSGWLSWSWHLDKKHQMLPYSCPLLHCDLSFKDRFNLENHLSSAHWYKQSWTCTRCDFSCLSKASFIIHRQLCQQKGVFECVDCKRHFKYAIDVLDHYGRRHI